MRVALDVSPLVQTRAGTARYVTELERRLARQFDLVRLSYGGTGRPATLARDVVWYPVVLPRAAARAGAAVLHCPTYRGPTRSPVPLVVTVHDLAVLRHPETFNRWTRMYSRVAVPRVVQAAARVIAVSEFTKRELVELLRVPEERIRVVPNAPTDAFTPVGPAAGGEYVLAVGTLEPRKNLERLAEATKRLGAELRVLGSRGWGKVSLNGHVRVLEGPDDATLAAAYRGARCFVYPSIYEGFGIPILEAMACGAPVVTSAGGATEEVAGGAAVLVDPLDPQAIAAGIEQAVARREELRRRGLERAAEFSWDAAAAATAEVYREAAGS